MVPTFSADKLYDGTPILSQSGHALAHAVPAGIRPMRLDVNIIASSVEELTEKVAEYGKHLDTQGNILEQMAKTIHNLKTEMSTSDRELKQMVGLDRGNMDGMRKDFKRAKDNKRELVRIRNHLRSNAKSETATTIEARRVCLNADNAMDQMNMAIEEELMLTEEEARAPALSRKVYPGRKSKTTMARVRAVPMRSRSHTLQGYKEVLIQVHFEIPGIPMSTSSKRCGKRKRSASADLLDQVASLLEKPTANKWLDNLAYQKSELGVSAIRKTIMRLMELVGASHRVVEPDNIEGTQYVDCTLAHAAIMAVSSKKTLP
ncbi:hypothetical protein I4F81_005425 [Pyropia yezoensis]|uniref:Uncharacterized protein n=1 Tax=Pyropia yezoensis TaxID=2788 RepID=A0ACC3BZ26_PYRYE|nr:hypothetical protein I4F81_005425 [Neopyropia yezoensis]